MSEVTVTDGPLQSVFEEEHLQECLRRVANNFNISGPKYSIELGTKTGDNYLGIVYRVSIDGKRKSDGLEAAVKVDTIIKVAPQDEMKRLMTSTATFFPREHLFYTEIVPVFNEFLIARNKRLENIPECYFSSAENLKEVQNGLLLFFFFFFHSQIFGNDYDLISKIFFSLFRKIRTTTVSKNSHSAMLYGTSATNIL